MMPRIRTEDRGEGSDGQGPSYAPETLNECPDLPVNRYGAPARLESDTTGFVSDFGRIALSNTRTKPTYADCWLIGSADELDLISEYRLPGARVTIGTSSDGETEYNLSPDEYTSADSVNALVSDVIDCVRSSYREKGGRMDRQSVLSEARGRIMDRSDTIEAVYGSNSIDIGKVIDNLCETVHRYTVGLGIFDILLSDPRLEDIYIDAPCDKNRIHVTMNGASGINSNLRCRTNLMVDRKEIMNLINVLKRDSGLQFSESEPVLETDMKGRDARATVIGYPMSPNGEAVSIRKHSTRPWTLTRLIANGTLDHETAGLLSFLVDNRCTFLVCGARGAGKSSLLTALMFEFPVSQRILTIEDTPELPGIAGLSGFPKASERTSGSSSSLGDIPWDNIKPSTQETGPGPDVRMDVRRAVSFTVTGTNSNRLRSSAARSTATNPLLRERDATTSSPTTPAWNPSARPMCRNFSIVFSANWGAYGLYA